MVASLGPFSEGRLFLHLGVLAGVGAAGLGLALAGILGLVLPGWATSVLLVVGFVVGLAVVFLGHVAWHRRWASSSGD